MKQELFKTGRIVVVGMLAVMFFGTFAGAWTGPSGPPPTNNVAPPVTLTAASQTITGNLYIGTGFGFSAPTLCIGVDCRSAWPAWTEPVRGSSFNYNTWTSSSAKAGAVRWVDGGSANTNGPTGGGNSTGHLVQFDPLYSSLPDLYKVQFAVPYDGYLYWRAQGNGNWGVWNQLAHSASASVPQGTLCGSRAVYCDGYGTVVYDEGSQSSTCMANTISVSGGCAVVTGGPYGFLRPNAVAGCPSGYSGRYTRSGFDPIGLGYAYYILNCVKD
ncbi:MAG: hypothetical protein AAB449_00330 [Patescibacteria group bacterium]